MFHEITFEWTNNATANFTGVALPSFQMDLAHFLLTRGPYGCGVLFVWEDARAKQIGALTS